LELVWLEVSELDSANVDDGASLLELVWLGEDVSNDEELAALGLDELQSVALTVTYSVTGTPVTYEV
jgi:hypothetical protein